MICTVCTFDLRWVRMSTMWTGELQRTLAVRLECPQCGTSYRIEGIDEKSLLTIPAPEQRSCLPPEVRSQELSDA